MYALQIQRSLSLNNSNKRNGEKDILTFLFANH